MFLDLCRTRCPQTQRDSSASVFWLQGLKVCASATQQQSEHFQVCLEENILPTNHKCELVENQTEVMVIGHVKLQRKFI